MNINDEYRKWATNTKSNYSRAQIAVLENYDTILSGAKGMEIFKVTELLEELFNIV